MRVLVIRFSSLGDCVLLCPLLARLKHAGAGEVVVLTKRAYADLFAAAEGVDRVVALDSGVTPMGLAQIAHAFREPGDVVIDAHASLRSRFVAWRAGGAAARMRKYTRGRLRLIVFKRPVALPSMLERYGALLEPAGFPAATLRPGGIRVPADAAQRAQAAVGGPDAIAVAPGSRWASKRWSGYARLCATLAERGHRIVLVGDEADRAWTSPIAAALGDCAVDRSGRVPLMDTAALIARCRVFVGNDSGLMHLAEAVGVPAVGLFGPTVEAFGYYPALPESRVVERRLACRPCSRNGATPCPKGTRECLERIEPDAVAGVVAQLLEGTGPHRTVLP